MCGSLVLKENENTSQPFQTGNYVWEYKYIFALLNAF